MNLIIIQARMDSKRFKGKALKPLKNKPILSWVIESAKNVKSNTDVIVATSTNPEDDIIYSFCNEEKVNVFRGDEKNVYSRYKDIVFNYGSKAKNIVRLTADNPLVPSELIYNVLSLHLKKENFYTSNVIDRKMPRGLDIEIVSSEYFSNTIESRLSEDEKEHVTLELRKNIQNYNYTNFEYSKYQKYPEVRLCIDYEIDLININKALEFYDNDKLENIIEFLHKEIKISNTKQTKIDGIEW